MRDHLWKACTATLTNRAGTSRTFTESRAACSRCAAHSDPMDDDDPWFTFRAGLVDQDGVYYSYLCAAGPDGLGGCLEDVWDEQAKLQDRAKQRAEKSDVLHELMPGDEDGCWSEMEVS